MGSSDNLQYRGKTTNLLSHIMCFFTFRESAKSIFGALEMNSLVLTGQRGCIA
jgi:hypothetical protein